MKRKRIVALAALVGTVCSSPVLAGEQEQLQLRERQQVYGWQMMSEQERQTYRQEMQQLQTEREREAYRLEHHEMMRERARQMGVTLPETPGPRGQGGAGVPSGQGGTGSGGGGRGGGGRR